MLNILIAAQLLKLFVMTQFRNRGRLLNQITRLLCSYLVDLFGVTRNVRIVGRWLFFTPGVFGALLRPDTWQLTAS